MPLPNAGDPEARFAEEPGPRESGMMGAGILYHLHQPQGRCERRVFLASRFPELASPPSEFDRMLRAKGREHEEAQAQKLAPFKKPRYPYGDLRAGAEATRALVKDRAGVIYQGVLLWEEEGLAGIPDFLIRDGDIYAIRDAKLVQNLDGHPEVALQLGAYGLLLEKGLGLRPSKLEVALGTGEIRAVEPSCVEASVSALARVRRILEFRREPDAPVSWSRCSECAFFGHCWKQALRQRDPGVVPRIDKGMRKALRSAGLRKYDEILRMDADELAALERPWGKRLQRVGAGLARKVVRQVRVLCSGKHEVFGKASFPPSVAKVYFDIESDPYDSEVGTRAYLWGLLVDVPGRYREYRPVVAPGESSGDRTGWQMFLEECRRIFDEFGDLCFIHYSAYEKTLVEQYVKRYGEDRVSAKLLGSLWDMKAKAVDRFVCLPVHSYGLKAIEKCAGFKRTLEERDARWSIGRYYAYTHAAEQKERDRILEEIVSYNKDDCLAMAHCLEWLASLAAPGPGEEKGREKC